MTEDQVKKMISKSNWKPEIEKYRVRNYSILVNRQKPRYILVSDYKLFDNREKYSLRKQLLYHQKDQGTFIGKVERIFEALPLDEAIKKADEIIALDDHYGEVVMLDNQQSDDKKLQEHRDECHEAKKSRKQCLSMIT